MGHREHDHAESELVGQQEHLLFLKRTKDTKEDDGKSIEIPCQILFKRCHTQKRRNNRKHKLYTMKWCGFDITEFASIIGYWFSG